MPRDLPARPNLEHLKAQAKQLLSGARDGDHESLERLRQYGALSANAAPRLVHAQHAIAREYGFASWPKLHAHAQALAAPIDPVGEAHAAAMRGDTRRLERLLREHPQLRAKLDDPLPGDPFGTTPLLAAVRIKSRELVDVLLQAGASIDQRSHWWAGGFGVLDHESEMAPYLIERGATVDAYAAARLGMLERLRALLDEAPERACARFGDGQTPLHVAASVEVAQLLLDRGADIDALDVDHESTPAQYLLREHTDVARHLVSRGARTDVFMAAALGDLARLRGHLDADPASSAMTVSTRSFPKRDFRAGGTIYTWVLGANKSPHAVAMNFGQREAYELLMERSSPEVRLAVACERADGEALRAVLDESPGLIASASERVRQRLVTAADARDHAAVQLMLDAGWPVDVRGEHGETALHWAAWHGNPATVRALLEAGAPLEVREPRFNGTPLRWATHGSVNCWHPETSDYAATVAALLDAGAVLPPMNDEFEASEEVREMLRERGDGPPG